MEAPLHITPFSIHIEPEILSDLRERIRKTRWPDQAPSVPWEQGTDLEYLRQLLEYWAGEFDWQAQESELNAVAQFRANPLRPRAGQTRARRSADFDPRVA